LKFKKGDKVRIKSDTPIRMATCEKSCSTCLKGLKLTIIGVEIVDTHNKGRTIHVEYYRNEDEEGYQSNCRVHPDDIERINVGWRYKLNE